MTIVEDNSRGEAWLIERLGGKSGTSRKNKHKQTNTWTNEQMNRLSRTLRDTCVPAKRADTTTLYPQFVALITCHVFSMSLSSSLPLSRERTSWTSHWAINEHKLQSDTQQSCPSYHLTITYNYFNAAHSTIKSRATPWFAAWIAKVHARKGADPPPRCIESHGSHEPSTTVPLAWETGCPRLPGTWCRTMTKRDSSLWRHTASWTDPSDQLFPRRHMWIIFSGNAIQLAFAARGERGGGGGSSK